MGKNFSRNNLGSRKASDFYETPYSMTWQLLQREVFLGDTLEPACGDGAIVKVLKDRGVRVTAYDLSSGTDFLAESRTFTAVITNPPYSKSMAFIQKAKQVAVSKVAMLLPLTYLHGQKRFAKVFKDNKFPLARVLVFTRAPMLGEELRDDGCYHTGMQVYAWYIWERSHTGEPVLGWIDNSRFVLRKTASANKLFLQESA